MKCCGIVGTEGKGLSGLEYEYDKVLRGSDGERTTVFDGKGRTLLVDDSREMRPGHNLSLTIDAPVQDEVERVLEGVAQVYRPKGATAIVANPRNGEILALANYPAIDGNDVDRARNRQGAVQHLDPQVRVRCADGRRPARRGAGTGPLA